MWTNFIKHKPAAKLTMEYAGKIHAKYDGLLDRVGFYIPYRKGEKTEQWAKVIRAFR